MVRVKVRGVRNKNEETEKKVRTTEEKRGAAPRPSI